ncbi:MFS transporter [Siccirubricoccus sp. KC 17139]|uniref:MFS transporter n=1 Tax=Siccirubricoccus soli TaxID=2899147 RepID=A0ABT1CZ18_9PROT|nr:MFS transporter [Siccirubricoccus soli]MCO6414909.1 MFS transporter [Siccirubricoccus soli]MCP2681039.1 MFS transporter [Siccirubricoccus soli]
MSGQEATLRGTAPSGIQARPDGGTTFAVILSLSFCHLLNDMMQSLVPALYPILKTTYGLDFVQVGLITLAFQCTASLFQPVVGLVTDRHPQPYSLAAGMGSTLLGLLLMAQASSYPVILLAAALIGLGSAVFHPEASRVARMAAGGRYGLAQSLFQVGGNAGTAAGPLLAAFIVVPAGQRSIVWFSAAALLGMLVLFQVGRWYAAKRAAGAVAAKAHGKGGAGVVPLPRRKVGLAILVLVVLLFSKNVYSASLGSYYTFYLIQTFGVSVQQAQLLLFLYLGAVVLGTLAGGVVGDRVGRVPVIWFSILGALPFTLALPHAGLFWTAVFTVLIGFIMASAFSAILVYAQDLMPGRVGLVAGIFFGFSFGLGGLGAAALGWMADWKGIDTVYRICAFLPLLGLATAFLPRVGRR